MCSKECSPTARCAIWICAISAVTLSGCGGGGGGPSKPPATVPPPIQGPLPGSEVPNSPPASPVIDYRGATNSATLTKQDVGAFANAITYFALHMDGLSDASSTPGPDAGWYIDRTIAG